MAPHMLRTTAWGPRLTLVGRLMKASRFQTESKAAIRKFVPPRSTPTVTRSFLDGVIFCSIKRYRPPGCNLACITLTRPEDTGYRAHRVTISLIGRLAQLVRAPALQA